MQNNIACSEYDLTVFYALDWKKLLVNKKKLRYSRLLMFDESLNEK